MSYNILNKNVKFQGTTQGTIEDVVDTHSDQSIAGQKTFSNLSSSSDVNVVGNISASLNISASAFYANGVLVDPSGGGGGAVSAVANGADNRIATFSSADALNGEQNLTFDGTTLTVTGVISGSGNISGSQFYGAWAGNEILGSQVQTASAGGIVDSSGLTLSVAGVTAQTTPNGNVTLFIDDGGTIKKSTIDQLLTNQSITDATALGNSGRVLLDGGVGTITSNASLSFAASTLTVNSSMNVDSNTLFVSASNDRVGIGTATPAASLEILNTSAQLQLSYNSTDNATFEVDDNGFLYITPSGGKTVIKNDLIIRDDVSNDTVVQLYDSSDDGVISGYANNQITTTIHANGTTFFNGGNVAIGTQTALETLSISGSFRVSGSAVQAQLSGSRFQISSSATIAGGGQSLLEIVSPTNDSLFSVVESGIIATNIVPAAFNANLYVSGAAVLGAPASAIADANLHNGSVTFYLDEGNNKLFFKVKDSIGQVKSGSVNLS